MTLLHGILSSLTLPGASGDRYWLHATITGPGIAPRDVRLVMERQPHRQAFLYFADDVRGLKRFIVRVLPEKLVDAPLVFKLKTKLSNGRPSEFVVTTRADDLKQGMRHFGFEA